MKTRSWVAVAGLMVMTTACVLGACKRRTPAVKENMARMAGTWEWRQAGAGKASVEVLELTAKGKYTLTTYQEIGGTRTLLYVNRFKADIRPEPDDPKQIEALKKEGFEPAIERGRYLLTLGEKQNTITFESDTVSHAEAAEGIGLRERTFLQPTEDEISIQGKTYRRQTAPATP